MSGRYAESGHDKTRNERDDDPETMPLAPYCASGPHANRRHGSLLQFRRDLADEAIASRHARLLDDSANLQERPTYHKAISGLSQWRGL